MDMLVKLYALPPSRDVFERLAKGGHHDAPRARSGKAKGRRLGPTEFQRRLGQRSRGSVFPPTGLLLHRDQEKEILGFAYHDATCPNFFGPTGVDQNERKNGIGKALLFNCLGSHEAAGIWLRHYRWRGPCRVLYKDGRRGTDRGSEPGVYRGLL